MTDYIERSCPLCGSRRSREEIRSKRRAEDLPFETVASMWHGFFRERVFFTYARCHDCALLYCPRYLSSEQLARLYASMPDNTAGVDVDLVARTQRRYAKMLLRSLPSASGAYLELGPDIGLVVEAMVLARTFSHLWLLEPNRAAHPSLLRRAGSTPTTLLASLDGVSSVPEQCVAAAAAVHVVDHLLEPLPLLRTLRTRLVPGGAVLLVAHDESSLLAKLTRTGWPPYCLQHPQLYRPRTLHTLLEAAGLTVEPTEPTVNDFPVGYLLQHGLHALGSRPAWRIPLGPSIPLRLGNMGCVAKRPD